MNSIKVSNGYLKMNDDDAEELLDTLMEQGILWEYISIIFNASVKEQAKYLAQVGNQEQDNKAMQEMINMMKAMQMKMDNIEKTVNEKTIVSSAPQSSVSAKPTSETNEEVKAPPKRKKKKVDTTKMNLGNGAFAQMASKMKQFEK